MNTPTWKSVLLDFRAPNQLRENADTRLQTSGKSLGATLQKPEQDAIAKADKDFQNALAQQQADDLNTRQEDRQLHDESMAVRGQKDHVENTATDQTNALELANLNNKDKDKKPKRWDSVAGVREFQQRPDVAAGLGPDEYDNQAIVGIGLNSPAILDMYDDLERQAIVEYMHQANQGSWWTGWFGGDAENANKVLNLATFPEFVKHWDLTQNAGKATKRKYSAAEANLSRLEALGPGALPASERRLMQAEFERDRDRYAKDLIKGKFMDDPNKTAQAARNLARGHGAQ